MLKKFMGFDPMGDCYRIAYDAIKFAAVGEDLIIEVYPIVFGGINKPIIDC